MGVSVRVLSSTAAICIGASCNRGPHFRGCTVDHALSAQEARVRVAATEYQFLSSPGNWRTATGWIWLPTARWIAPASDQSCLTGNASHELASAAQIAGVTEVFRKAGSGRTDRLHASFPRSQPAAAGAGVNVEGQSRSRLLMGTTHVLGFVGRCLRLKPMRGSGIPVTEAFDLVF